MMTCPLAGVIADVRSGGSYSGRQSNREGEDEGNLELYSIFFNLDVVLVTTVAIRLMQPNPWHIVSYF
jgi:hypothetical protein